MTTEDTAMEMALAANLNVLLLKHLQAATLNLLAVQEKQGGPDKLTDGIAEQIIKMRDEINILMDRYNDELGKVSDADPEMRTRVKDRIKGHDVINGLELAMRMSAKDRLAQLILRGH